MNVLAIGAHFDDIELGCGGALAKHVKNGDKVIGFIATSSGFNSVDGDVLRRDKDALKEAQNASRIIGYQLLQGKIPTFYLEYGEDMHAMLLKIIEENCIELIYTHWSHDVHHDHRNLALCTLHVARHVNRLLMYKSNWYISDQKFHENFYVDISDTWDIKERAIKAYESEMARTGELWCSYFKNEAVNNGLKIGVKYAEAFQNVRWFI